MCHKGRDRRHFRGIAAGVAGIGRKIAHDRAGAHAAPADGFQAGAGHAAGRNDRWPIIRQGFEQVFFLRLIVKALHHQIAVGECRRHIGRLQSQHYRFDLRLGRDAPQVFSQCIDLEAADLVVKIKLPVEVGLIHAVEIHDLEPAHAAADQMDRHIGADAPGAGDADFHAM